jgi:hypothetical protein
MLEYMTVNKGVGHNPIARQEMPVMLYDMKQGGIDCFLPTAAIAHFVWAFLSGFQPL